MGTPFKSTLPSTPRVVEIEYHASAPTCSS